MTQRKRPNDPWCNHSDREVFAAIQEGRMSMHEFGYWYCYRLADTASETMQEERERYKHNARINAFAVPV